MIDLRLDAHAFGLLSSCFLLPYALLQIPTGLMLDRYATGLILFMSCFLCTVSTAGFSLTENYNTLLFFRTCTGVGSAVAVLSCMKVAIDEFPRKAFGLFAGLILFVGGSGAICGKILLAYLLNWLNWRGIMAVLACMGVLLTIAIGCSFDLKQRSSPSTNDTSIPPLKDSLREVLSNPLMLCFGLYALLMTAPSDAFAGLWSSVYFSQVNHLSHLSVEFLGSVIFIGMALGSPLVSSLDHVFKARFELAAALALFSAVTFVVIIYANIKDFYFLSVLCFVYGLASVYVLAFVMAQDCSDVSISGVVSGFINTLSIVGSFSLQTFIGTLMTVIEPDPLFNDGQIVYQQITFQYAFSSIVIFYLLSAVVMCVLLFKMPKFRPA